MKLNSFYYPKKRTLLFCTLIWGITTFSILATATDLFSENLLQLANIPDCIYACLFSAILGLLYYNFINYTKTANKSSIYKSHKTVFLMVNVLYSLLLIAQAIKVYNISWSESLNI